MRLLIIRHADPDYPNNTITPAGHIEAQALSKLLIKQGLDKIFTSPLGRAIDTAHYTAEPLGITPVILPWTAELEWPRFKQESLGVSVPWDTHGHTIRQSHQEFSMENWHTIPPFDNPAYIADYKRLQQDSDAFLANLGYQRDGGIYRVNRRNTDKVAVFCHGGFGLTWLSHLLMIPLPLMWSGFVLTTSSVTTILFDERLPGIATPRCLALSDKSHLYESGLPVQPSGIKANLE